MKDIIARKGQTATQLLSEPVPTPRVNAVIDERGICARIRNLERDLEAEQARNALLQSELKIANDLLTSYTATKKRKRVKPNMDSNEKSVSFQAILATQQVAQLEEEEKKNRAKWRAAKTENKARKAQNTAI